MTQHVNIDNCAFVWGNDELPYGVDKSTEEPHRHEAYIGGIRIPFDAQSDEDAIQKGHALIVEKLKEVFEEFVSEKFGEFVSEKVNKSQV